jgi:hypothetical protein
MNQLRIPSCALVCFASVVLSGALAVAQSRLLAELRTQGSCVECSPPIMNYGIGFTIRESPSTGAGWSISGGISDIAQSFDLPSNLLPSFNNVLTHNGPVDGNMNCCNGDVGTINSGGLTNGTQQDKVMITRFVPPLGLNFFGYQITNLTMTIDRLEWIPISSSQFRAETGYTARIYGTPEPLASGLTMIGFGLVALWIRLPRRKFRPYRRSIEPRVNL